MATLFLSISRHLSRHCLHLIAQLAPLHLRACQLELAHLVASDLAELHLTLTAFEQDQAHLGGSILKLS